MSLVRTTASAAIAAGDSSIVVASATGFVAGYLVRCDQENMRVRQDYSSGTTIPVIRGQDGTLVAAHPITSGVVVGTAADWSTPTAQTLVQYPIAGRARTLASYTTAGAISLPTAGSDAVAMLNSTVALAMTLANPGVDMDGCELIVIGNGKAAHTITYTAGIGNAGSGYTVLTFDTGGQCCVRLMAANAIWVPCPSTMSGTLTAVDVAVA